jgi:hypothetical protein
MSILVLAVLTGLLVVGISGCRLMPFETGSRIVPKRLARFFYGEPLPKK